MRHDASTDATHAYDPSPTLSWAGLGLTALLAALVPAAVLAAAYPVLAGVVALGLGSLALAVGTSEDGERRDEH